MPWGVALFLAYAFLILAGGGLALGGVVDQAILTPITLAGVVLMALLAYTIFTITLVLQRKAAARGLALGLTSLALPAIPIALLARQPVAALLIIGIAAGVIAGLRRPAVKAWLDQD